jgi:hypothetical protein
VKLAGTAVFQYAEPMRGSARWLGCGTLVLAGHVLAVLLALWLKGEELTLHSFYDGSKIVAQYLLGAGIASYVAYRCGYGIFGSWLASVIGLELTLAILLFSGKSRDLIWLPTLAVLLPLLFAPSTVLIALGLRLAQPPSPKERA